MSDHAVQFTSVNEQLVAVLRKRILSGDLPPGAALPEVRLAEEFGVSRNTVREAVRRLLEEGLVEQPRRRTATVVDLTADDARDLYAVRRLLELTALERLEAAWPSETDRVNACFRDISDQALNDRADADQVIAADLVFHRSIVNLHRSRRLLRSFERIRYELAFCDALVAADMPDLFESDRLLPEHDAIRAAIVDRDPALAHRLLTAHLEFCEETTCSVLAGRTKTASVSH